EAGRMLEEARRGVAEILGADLDSKQPDRVIFTSGGTEANNLAILGIVHNAMSRGDSPGHVVISSIEHSSVVGPIEQLMDEGWDVDALPAASDGRLRHEFLAGLFQKDTRLVTTTMANHETGVLQPIAELAAVCNKARVPLHTDAVQMAGKLPIDFHALGLAAMSISAHKFGGPPGVGALVLRHGEELIPQQFGGEQQDGLRPGTESVALARGLWTAMRLAQEEQADCADRLNSLRCHFETELRGKLTNIEIHGSTAPRLPQTASIAFPGRDARELVKLLDDVGIACSVGSACTSGSDEPSPTLLAMGVSTELARASLRFSLGRTTSRREVDMAIERIVGVCG
ncbi:MAG: cysteine desulfurase, partial [Pirellulales bacterium]|nr:cysteine desulfurase [Pirellulales bacterium]